MSEAKPPESGPAEGPRNEQGGFLAEGKAEARKHLWKLVFGGLGLILAGVTAFSWNFLVGGGLVRALGGVTAADTFPREALIVTPGNCPTGWQPHARATGRFLIGAGSGQGLKDRPLARDGGQEEHTIAVTELPPHSHGGTTDPQSRLPGQFVELVTTQIVAIGSGSPFGGGGQTVRTAQPQPLRVEIQLPVHVHSFTTDGGRGLTGRAVPDNNMPPWLAVSICERKPS